MLRILTNSTPALGNPSQEQQQTISTLTLAITSWTKSEFPVVYASYNCVIKIETVHTRCSISNTQRFYTNWRNTW